VRSLKTYQIIRRRHHGYEKKRGESQHSFSPWITLILCLLGVFCAGTLLWAGLYYSSLTSDLPSIDRLDTSLDPGTGSQLQPTRFYDRSGKILIQTLENPGIVRQFLTVDPALRSHFSPQLVRAVVAMQQPDYWHSSGFSTQDLFNPIPVTIAEKLVSNLLLENEPESARKAIRMRLLAGQVTRKYGASKVLEWYLNSANFGHLAYGAESAAELYYGKSASDLDLMEAALLVAISESPALNPIDAPSQIDELQKTALNRLLLAGVINSSEYINYLNEKPIFMQPAQVTETATSPFIDLVIAQLSKTIGRQQLERGGLKVITSLDAATQKQLECTLFAQLGHINSTIPSSKGMENCDASRLLPSINSSTGQLHDGLNTEGIITDPQSGEILAMTRDTSLTGSAPTASPHPPGSLLTPFLAAAAFARGYSPSTLVWDIPDATSAAAETRQNADAKFHGPVSIRTAIANDYLAPLAKVFNEIGGENLEQIWSPFGLGRVSQATPQSDLLYQGGLLTPLQAAQSFGVFAANGQGNGVQLGDSDHLQPRVVLAVEDVNGSLIGDPPAVKTLSVLGQDLAYLINNILSDEDARKKSMGSSNPFEIGRPAGGKAGQTTKGDGLWSVEYTPQRLAAIWLGQNNEKANSTLDLKMATGITHALLQYVSRDLPKEGWDLPPGVSEVEVCDPSGELPTKNCPNIIQEVFLAGSEPTSTDPLYQRIAVNR
jgi:membrane peptidoglycan carboxypeptidase